MEIVCISDTHLQHMNQAIIVPDGDVLVHAGDATFNGSESQIRAFAAWMKSLPHKHKLFVPGNHDLGFEDDLPAALCCLDGRARTLIDEGITIDGVKFYGSPWQPEFMGWGFNLPRGRKLRAKWALIPDDTQVLITHGPPAGVLDLVTSGEHVGCADLTQALSRLKQLRLHVFGHIHYSYGTAHANGVNYFNASVCNERYMPINPPLVYEL